MISGAYYSKYSKKKIYDAHFFIVFARMSGQANYMTFVQDLKDIVRDEAGRTGNYLGDIVIDPERSDFLGKII